MELQTIVKVLIVNDAGEVLFLRRSQTDTRRPGQWDLPGGNVEKGEDLKVAVIRETVEESGITIRKPVPVYAVSETRPPHGYPTWVFFGEKVKGTPAVGLSYEHDDYKWMMPAQALKEVEYELHRKLLRYVHENKLLDLLP